MPSDAKINLKVEFAPQIENIKKHRETLGGMKDGDGKTPLDKSPNAKRNLDLLIDSIDKLSEVAEPGHTEVIALVQSLVKANEIIQKLADSGGVLSKEMVALLDKQKNLTEQIEKEQKKLDDVQKKGKYDSSTKTFKYSKTHADNWAKEQDSFVYKAGAHKGKKASWASIEGAAEKGDWSKFEDPAKAQATYQSFIDSQKEQATIIEQCNQNLATFREELNKTSAAITKQAEVDEKTNPGTQLYTEAGQDITDTKITGSRVRGEMTKKASLREDSIKGIDSDMAGSGKKTESAFGRAAKTLTIYSVIVKTLKSAIKEAKDTVTELDKELTQQAMVTGKTRQETYALVGSYQKLATQCGATTKEIAGVATEYMKQGKTISESLVLTEAAVSAAKVAGVSTADSVNYLTTALNGFQLAAEDAMKVSDKFAAVAAASATDYDELAIALSKVASQANLAGMSIDYTTALLTKGLETTREAPETMGTALKTIIARMRELSDYGETLEGDADINKVEQQLAYVGIALRDQQGELRSTEDVLDDLGKKWDTLNANQQAAVAKALAGTRQQSRLIAMMSDYERVTELQQISQRSQGATMAQMDKYLESMESASNNVRVAWEKIITTVTSSDAIIGLVQKLANLLEKVNKILSGQAGFWGNIVKTVAIAKLTMGGLAKLSEKSQQNKINRINNRAQTDERLAQIDTQKKALQDKYLEENPEAKKEIEDKLKAKNKDYKAQKDAEEADLKEVEQAKSEKEDADKDVEAADKEVQQADAELKQATEEYDAAAEAEEIALKEEENALIELQNVLKENAIALGTAENEVLQQHLRLLEAENALIAAQNALKAAGDDEAKQQAAQQQVEKAQQEVEAAKQGEQAAQQVVSDTLKSNEERKQEKEKNLEEKKAQREEKTKAKEEAAKKKDSAKDKKNKADAKLTKEKEKQTKATKKLENAEKKYQNTVKAGQKFKKEEEKLLSAKLKGSTEYNKLLAEESILQGSLNAVGQAGLIIQGAMNIINTIALVGQSLWNAGKIIGIALSKKDADTKKKSIMATVSQTAATGAATGAQWGFNAAMAANPVGAVVTAILLLITALIAVIAIIVMFVANYESGAEKAAKKVNKLSAEIYELDQRAQNIRNITNEFDALDNKILKTSEDLKQMDALLDQAAEELDNEEVDDKKDKGYGKGISQREYYDSLETAEAKREFLDKAIADSEAEADKKRKEQLDTINALSGDEKKKFLTSRDADMVKARDAIYAINNNQVYKNIDALKASGELTDEAAAATEALTQSLLSQVDAYTALAYANKPSVIQDLTKALAEAEVAVDDFNYSVSEVLTSDDFDLKDKIRAFDEAAAAVAGNTEALDALNKQYNEFKVFKEMGSDVIDFIDEAALSYDQINALHGMMKDLNKELKDEGFYINPEHFDTTFSNLMTSLAENSGDIGQTIESTFGSYLSSMEYMGEDWVESWNTIVTKLNGVLGKSILDIGQDMDSLKNNINDFYDKASQWSELSETERTQFLNDNAELFKGEDGAELLKAFQSNNYDLIQDALENNNALNNQLDSQLEQIKQQIKIEESYIGEARNEALIKQLKDYEKFLENREDMFMASLELQLEKEQEQIDTYREYLEEQQSALEESLNKRKEAYENYFDQINEEKEAEDYEEEANRLINNISKLSTTSNADSQKQKADLEAQLEKLEEQRLETLREKAQEAMLENIDDTIEEINDKFDKLLDNNRDLLKVMTEDLENSAGFVSDLIASKAATGATNTEMQQYLKDIEATYGSALKDFDWDSVSVAETNNSLVLNVAGKEIVLSDQKQQNVYEAVMKALTEIGVN